MYCPRLEHYARLNANGSIGMCGHMVKPKTFSSFEKMETSEWKRRLLNQMHNDIWPIECKRCKDTENIKQSSIRLDSIKRDKLLSKFRKDYIQLGGTLDNYCNSACVMCSENLSTKIGNLKKHLVIKDNFDLYNSLPHDRIVELDINGGEPSISINYNKLLDNIPSNVKIIRINTNANRLIKQLKNILDKGISVIITVSFDGIGQVHDYIRYPVKWKNFEKNLLTYRELVSKNKLLTLDTWTTVQALNINQLNDIKEYCRKFEIRHEFALLENPSPLNVKYKNKFTIKAKEQMPNNIAIDRDNTKELEAFLNLEESCRPSIERFWI